MKPAPRRLLCGKSASVGCDTGKEELSKVAHEQAHQPALYFCSVIALTPVIWQLPDRPHRWLFTDF
jgi:hypothetical protein